ncbi:MAG TPA: enoyl-CoA hydratase/isomerase family protein [Syntrophorhabdales bacterium]|nr:enoyl-CoA hydratase/isomerase family protein [Syntrophorhabdales bacterium]
MNTNQVVIVERKNGVGIITLNRPKKANALNHELKEAITKALEELGSDTKIGAILLKGAGKHFCAGQDFNDVVLGTDQKDLEECRHVFSYAVTTIFEQIINMGTPVIAAIRGMITGEGLPLAISCDLVVASDNTVFQFPGTNLDGISIGPGVVAARYMGIKEAMWYLLTGEPILASEAKRLGMVNRVVPDERLEEEAMAVAEKVAYKTLRNSVAVKELGKSVFYMALDMERSKAFRYAHQMLAQIFITPPAIDGAKLFLEGKLTKAQLQLEGLVKE